MIKFYVKYHRLDKLFEEEEIFRQAYKLYGGRKTDKNWIAYLHKICRDAYLTNSVITIYEMQEPDFVCVKLGVMATADNCDYVSPNSTHLLSDADLILSIMGIKTEMMTDHSEVGVFLLNLDFQDLPSPDIIEPILTSSEVNLHTQLYQAYLDQKFTDVTLVANNKNFKLHKVVLYSMGGDYFKRLYNSKFGQPPSELLLPGYRGLPLDENSKILSDIEPTSNYSSQTISLYIDYLYLESVAFENQPDIDIIELFELAQACFQHNLQIDCLNLINAQATPKDLPALEDLNQRYPNSFLTKIISSLKSFNDRLRRPTYVERRGGLRFGEMDVDALAFHGVLNRNDQQHF